MPSPMPQELYPDPRPMPGQLPLFGLSEDAASALAAAVRLSAWAMAPARCPRLVYGRESGEFSAAEWMRELGPDWRESFSRGGRLWGVHQEELLPLRFVVGSGWNYALSGLGRRYAAEVLGLSVMGLSGPAPRGSLARVMARR